MSDHRFSNELLEIKATIECFDILDIAIVFGSIAKGSASAISDLDIAVNSHSQLDATTKLSLIEALASVTGRSVDMVDLKEVGEPLLGQILQNGTWLLGSDVQKGAWLSRHLIDSADFLPYKTRILAERRNAWINKSS